jgi:APA family basic amino acid/polyamine antiporter
VGAIVVIAVGITDVRSAIGFSSFAVLTYYAIANASAWTLGPEHRRWPRALAALGLLGCATLGFTLPSKSILAGAALLAAGAAIHGVRRLFSARAVRRLQ